MNYSAHQIGYIEIPQTALALQWLYRQLYDHLADAAGASCFDRYCEIGPESIGTFIGFACVKFVHTMRRSQASRWTFKNENE